MKRSLFAVIAIVLLVFSSVLQTEKLVSRISDKPIDTDSCVGCPEWIVGN